MSTPDLSGVPLADLAAELKRRASVEAGSVGDRQAIAIDLANAIRCLGFYAQVWLPEDVGDYLLRDDVVLTDDELREVFRRMGKWDEAAIEANANLLESIVDDVLRERKESEAAR